MKKIKMQMIIWFSYIQVYFGNCHHLSTILNCYHIINILTTSTHAVRLLIFTGNLRQLISNTVNRYFITLIFDFKACLSCQQCIYISLSKIAVRRVYLRFTLLSYNCSFFIKSKKVKKSVIFYVFVACKIGNAVVVYNHSQWKQKIKKVKKSLDKIQ